MSDAVTPVARAPVVGVYRFWRDSGYVAGGLISWRPCAWSTTWSSTVTVRSGTPSRRRPTYSLTPSGPRTSPRAPTGGRRTRARTARRRDRSLPWLQISSKNRRAVALALISPPSLGGHPVLPEHGESSGRPHRQTYPFRVSRAGHAPSRTARRRPGWTRRSSRRCAARGARRCAERCTDAGRSLDSRAPSATSRRTSTSRSLSPPVGARLRCGAPPAASTTALTASGSRRPARASR